MHSHLLPGIDDGSKSMEESMGMILKFSRMGYRKLFMTPHIMEDYYRNTPEIIHGKLEEVRKEVKEFGMEIELGAAAEYYYDETLIDKVKGKELLTFGDNYVLFEYAFGAEPQRITSLIFEMKTNGYRPVLAHYERYPYYHNQPEKIQEYRDNGVLIQLNLLSLCGHYGPFVEKQAKYLVDNGLIDFVGSDCHRIEHLQILEKNASNPYFHKLKELNLLNQSL
ncbi:MAG: capsular biosynthesis protein [Bacteroidetes bacterium]|nr:MAG: capsular biosynthesis protein [Bacteroidota bacterium]